MGAWPHGRRRCVPARRTESLAVDDLELEVRWSDRRRTVELVVERDGSLVVRAPRGARRTTLARFVRERRGWLDGKLAERRAVAASRPARRFEEGEVYWYLGRTHPLVLVDEQEAALRLDAGRFSLRRTERVAGRDHFVRWYTEHADPWFRQRTVDWAPEVGAAPSALIVRDLGRRWGSCTSASGRVRLHWAVIQMPAPVAEYVLVHELVHLVEPNHSSAFWDGVERLLPDYRERKAWLRTHGERFTF